MSKINDRKFNCYQKQSKAVKKQYPKSTKGQPSRCALYDSIMHRTNYTMMIMEQK